MKVTIEISNNFPEYLHSQKAEIEIDDIYKKTIAAGEMIGLSLDKGEHRITVYCSHLGSKAGSVRKRFLLDAAHETKIFYVPPENISEFGKLTIEEKKTVDTEIESSEILGGSTNTECTKDLLESDELKIKDTESEPIDTEKPGSLICPFCLQEIFDTDIFCPFCGKTPKSVKWCDQCGATNEVDDNFCFQCGTKI